MYTDLLHKMYSLTNQRIDQVIDCAKYDKHEVNISTLKMFKWAWRTRLWFLVDLLDKQRLLNRERRKKKQEKKNFIFKDLYKL